MSAITELEPITQTGERRSRPRVRVALPLVLSRRERASRIEGVTQDVSCHGFSFVAAEAVPLAEMLEGEIIVPGDPVSSVPEDDLHLRFRAQVVHVDPRGRDLGFTIGCRIDGDGLNCCSIDRAPA